MRKVRPVSSALWSVGVLLALMLVVALSTAQARPLALSEPTTLDAAEALGATVFHAGTKLADGQLITSGGRVLGVTASGNTLADAIKHAYQAVGEIHFEGMHFRSDIGAKGLGRW